MAVDVTRVMVGTPDQKTTGAILDAPIGTKLPTSATEKLAEGAFRDSGYVSEDGVSLTTDRSTSDLKEWGGNTVRKVLESFDGTIKWSEIQMSYEALCHAFGIENVKVIPATEQHGEQITAEIGAELPEARSWIFKMKDGRSRMLIVVPNGQVTELDDITFTSSDPVSLPLTLACYPDSEGNSIYIYFDDGRALAANAAGDVSEVSGKAA